MKKLFSILVAITVPVFIFYHFNLSIEVKRAWAQVQQNVGMYSYVPTTVTTGPRWMRNCATISPTADAEPATAFTNAPNDCTVLDTDSILHGFNGTSFDRIRTGVQSSVAPTGGLTMINHHSDGGALIFPNIAANIDGMSVSLLPASGNMIFNGATWDRQRNMADGANATGLSAAMTALASGATGAAGFNRAREASATNLTATTSLGVAGVYSHSGWSITNTPAAATQATVSKASGGGTVRHVATGVTVCIAAGATAQTPILAHIRDGGTGAGTILRSFAFSAPVNSSECQSFQDMSMIGTAATAMTVEFAAAGVAASQQTVTLTGFSVP